MSGNNTVIEDDKGSTEIDSATKVESRKNGTETDVIEAMVCNDRLNDAEKEFQ